MDIQLFYQVTKAKAGHMNWTHICKGPQVKHLLAHGQMSSQSKVNLTGMKIAFALLTVPPLWQHKHKLRSCNYHTDCSAVKNVFRKKSVSEERARQTSTRFKNTIQGNTKPAASPNTKYTLEPYHKQQCRVPFRYI